MAIRVIAMTGGAALLMMAAAEVLLAAWQPTSEPAAPALLQRWRVGREALAQMPKPRRLPCLACLPKGVVEPDRKMGRAANKGRKGSTGWYICGKTNSGKKKRCYSSKKKRAKIPKRKEGRGMLQV